MLCNICGRDASNGYVNIPAGEKCVDPCHDQPETVVTYLRNSRSWSLAKQVNGGNWISFGTYATELEASNALLQNREFHAERCPRDEVNYSLREV